MSLVKALFGPSRDEIWRQLSRAQTWTSMFIGLYIAAKVGMEKARKRTA